MTLLSAQASILKRVRALYCVFLLGFCQCIVSEVCAQDVNQSGSDTLRVSSSSDSSSAIVPRVFADSIAAHASDSTVIVLRQPTEKQLQDALHDADYTYDRTKKPQNFTWLDWLKNWLERRFIPHPSSKTGSTIVDVILGAAIIALVVLIGMWLSKTGFRGLLKGAPKTITMLDEEIVENIHEMPLDRLIEEAVARQEYRRAVRYLFLRELQSLTQQGVIVWSGYKTNSDYRAEIRDADLRDRFRKLCHVYEAVWYGEHLPDAHSYAELQTIFEEFSTTSHRTSESTLTEVNA